MVMMMKQWKLLLILQILLLFLLLLLSSVGVRQLGFHHLLNAALFCQYTIVNMLRNPHSYVETRQCDAPSGLLLESHALRIIVVFLLLQLGYDSNMRPSKTLYLILGSLLLNNLLVCKLLKKRCQCAASRSSSSNNIDRSALGTNFVPELHCQQLVQARRNSRGLLHIKRHLRGGLGSNFLKVIKIESYLYL